MPSGLVAQAATGTAHTCPSHQQAAVGQGDPSCLLSQSQLSHVGSTPQGWKAGWFGPAPLLVPQVSS